jgi:hypothetical protein
VDREQARAAALLDRRTTTLATRAARGQRHDAATQPLIVWGLDDSLFGTDVEAIAGVIPFAGCARVPTREAACLGVIGRAGRFYSVIGMRRLLGMAAGDSQPGHLLLLRGAAPYLAMAVDRVFGRFDLAGDGPSLSFEGRLVAPFAPAELRARLGASPPAPRSLESMPS